MLSVSDTQVLLKARDIINSNDRTRVCTALYSVANSIGTHAALMSYRKLKGYINYSLGGHDCLEAWQLEQGFKRKSDQECKQDRVAWMTWMLGEEVLYETCKT